MWAESELLKRWPESKVAPDLSRITALMTLLGDPQFSAPVIHIAGTNGKTSTARMVESLLRGFGMTTGLFTSPALHSMTERIAINGKPISPERFEAAYCDVVGFLDLVDETSIATGGPPVTMFEAMSAMAFAAFADTPVDVMVIECGMGGRWDATNVVSPAVSTITSIGYDHTEYLGDTLEQIAAEKAGIIKSAVPVVLARQHVDAAAVLLATSIEHGVDPSREGLEFAVRQRTIALGGQQLTLQGLAGTYDDIYLPLHGAYQASNAVVALATVEAFFGAGTRALDVDVVREGFAAVTSPGRLELVRTSPALIVDAAHNPAGASSAAAAISESFGFEYVIGIVAVLADKDAAGLLAALEPVFNELVVTANSSPRSMPVGVLAELAVEVFGDDRVVAVDSIPDAVARADAMAVELGALGHAGIVAIGSVVTAADVRAFVYAPPTPEVDKSQVAKSEDD